MFLIQKCLMCVSLPHTKTSFMLIHVKSNWRLASRRLPRTHTYTHLLVHIKHIQQFTLHNENEPKKERPGHWLYLWRCCLSHKQVLLLLWIMWRFSCIASFMRSSLNPWWKLCGLHLLLLCVSFDYGFGS